jgi:hypothetical protein
MVSLFMILQTSDLNWFKISEIVLAILGLLFSVVLQLYADRRPRFLPDHFYLISLYSVISYTLS